MSVRELAEGQGTHAWKKLLQPVLDRPTPVGCQEFPATALTVNLGYRFYAHNLHRFYTCDWPPRWLGEQIQRQPQFLSRIAGYAADPHSAKAIGHHRGVLHPFVADGAVAHCDSLV